MVNGGFLIGLSGLGLLKGFVVAGLLSTTEYGIWGIVSVSLGTLLSLKQAGVGDRFVQQDEDDERLAFHKAFTVELVFTAAFAVLLLAAVPLLAVIYGEPEILAPGLVMALALPAGVLQAPLWVFYRRMQFVRQRTLQAIDPVVGFVVTIVLAAAGAGYWSLVIGIVAGVWASGVAAVLASPYPIRLAWDPAALRRYWSFSWPLLVTAASTLVLAQGALIIGEASLGVAGVGAIVLAQTVAQFADRVDGILTGTMYPAICAVRDRRDLLLESFVKSNRLALMWGVPFGAGLTLFAADLIDFGIGDKWAPGLLLFQVFGLTAALGHIGFNWHAYYRALGRTRPIAVVQVIVAVVFVVALVGLVPPHGLDGFAIAVGIMTVTVLAARGVYLAQLFPGFVLTRHAARAVAPTIPAVAVVLAVRQLGSGDRTLGLAVAELALYAAVTAAVTIATERRLLREAIGYVRRPHAVSV